MIIHRSNSPANRPQGSAEDCFKAMQHHHERRRSGHVARAAIGGSGEPPVPPAGPGNGGGAPIPGDVIYGAKAIAEYIFGKVDKRTRRRVFNVAAHYRTRGEHAGFFKLKGALCLCISRWREFHGL